MADSAPISKPSGDYRKHLPDISIPRFTTMKQQDAHVYANDFKTNHQPPWLWALYRHWRSLFEEPFKGVTNDGMPDSVHVKKSAALHGSSCIQFVPGTADDSAGNVRDGLFQLQDEEVPIDSIVAAANNVLSEASKEQRATLSYHVDSPEWRSWSNPEFLLSDKGLRLDELTPSLRDSILAVLKATLSPEGYDKAVKAMRINHFLGELVDSPRVMNEFSYNFVLFGRPSPDRPWGWSFYGHHLCLNAFFYRRQLVLSPWFTGAEPNEIDSGPYKGTRILTREEDLGLKLMRSLPENLQQRAQTYKLMHDPAMPEGRWNKDDQRHLCGAYRDNRVVPYEGIRMDEMDGEQRGLVKAILDEYLLYLPKRSRELKLQHAMHFEHETYFSWIGGYGTEDPFYYRIQNPVIIIEFDHHSGVFLNNEEPAKFHIHTLLRTPNAGDYGFAMRPLIASAKDHFVWDPSIPAEKL
ncbi:hypothetical protein H2203_006366 [Taxawa tesnikishii (nom. ined.)]|nr:hypothetical protein H2203_006366 [Dothideales sp. JES 119]